MNFGCFRLEGGLPLHLLFLISGSGSTILWLLMPQTFSLPPHIQFTCWHCLYRSPSHHHCHRACPGHQPFPLRLLWEPPSRASCFSSPVSLPTPQYLNHLLPKNVMAAGWSDLSWRCPLAFFSLLLRNLQCLACGLQGSTWCGHQSPDFSSLCSSQGGLLSAPLTCHTLCHFLPLKGPTCLLSYFSCMCVCLVAQSCPSFCDLMDCSPPDSFVHGIFQATILEWLPFPSPGDLSDPGIEPWSLALQVNSLPSEPPEKSSYFS